MFQVRSVFADHSVDNQGPEAFSKRTSEALIELCRDSMILIATSDSNSNLLSLKGTLQSAIIHQMKGLSCLSF